MGIATLNPRLQVGLSPAGNGRVHGDVVCGVCREGACDVCRMLGADLRGEWWDIPGGDCLLCSRGLSAAIPTGMCRREKCFRQESSCLSIFEPSHGFHAVFLHPILNFFYERNSFVVLFLSFDVIDYFVSFMARIGKCTITILPAIPLG